MPHVFVTGGSGYVGRNLIPYLLQHGDSVTALSRSDKADGIIKDAAASAGGKVSIVRGSLESDRAVLVEGMTGCDAVIHSAAKVDGWGPWEPFQQTNVDGTRNMVAAARQAKVPRFVHIGTEAILLHDRFPIHMADESVPAPLPPFHAPYTRSKILAERAVLDANDPDSGFSTIVVRPRFVWGLGDTVNLPEVLEAVDSGSWRFFSPRFQTSTTHVKNLAEAARLAISKGTPGTPYFVTDGEHLDMEDFLTRLMETQGRKKPSAFRIPYILAWAFATFMESIPLLGYGVTKEPVLNRQMLGLMARELTLVDSKARRELGYTSHVSMDEGFREMREHYDAEHRA